MAEWIVVAVLLLIVLGVVGGVTAAIVLAVRSRGQRQPTPQTSSAQPGPLVSAGWYDDGNGATRWYDGARWTPHTR